MALYLQMRWKSKLKHSRKYTILKFVIRTNPVARGAFGKGGADDTLEHPLTPRERLPAIPESGSGAL